MNFQVFDPLKGYVISTCSNQENYISHYENIDFQIWLFL